MGDVSCEARTGYTVEGKIKLLSDGPSACGNCTDLAKSFGDVYVKSAESLDALNKTCEHLSGVHAKAIADFEEAKAAAQGQASNTDSLYAHRSEKDRVVVTARDAWREAVKDRDAFHLKRAGTMCSFQRVSARKLECEILATAMYRKLVSA